MDTIQIVYLICFFLGLGWAVISALMAGLFGGHEGGGDIGHDVDMGGDLSHDVEVSGHPDTGEVHFSPVSPVVLATFIATFGGTGLILREAGLPIYAQIPCAAGAAFLLAAAIFYLFWKIFSMTQFSSEARISQVVGSEAQVTTTIPINGVGEIAYTAAGSRYTAPARASDGKEIGPQSIVRIAKIVGNIYYVERLT